MPTEHTARPPADAPRHARAAWDWFEAQHPDCAIRRMWFQVDPLRWAVALEKTCGAATWDAVRVGPGGLVL